MTPAQKYAAIIASIDFDTNYHAVMMQSRYSALESVKTGKYADFVVLNKNLYSDETLLSDDLVQTAIINGRIVYEK